MGDGMTDIENKTALSVADAVRFVSRALVQSGVSETNAAKVAAALVAAEIDGQKGSSVLPPLEAPHTSRRRLASR